MTRVCLKTAFYQICFPICTQRAWYWRFVPNDGGAADYVDRIWYNIPQIEGETDGGNDFSNSLYVI